MSSSVRTIQSLERKKLPQHVVIVPDGNRRWAKKHNLSPGEGHRAGVRALDRILKVIYSSEIRIQSLSFWALSLDNVRHRSHRELDGLFALLEEAFHRLLNFPEIHRAQVKINAFGEWDKLFPKRARETIRATLSSTLHYKRHSLNFFIAYDGYKEILDAVEKIRNDKQHHHVTPELFKSKLYTKDLPPIDYVIRTGGEPHWSAGAFLWDAGYSQLYFTRKLWPDFSSRDFLNAILDYTKRGRRFGT